jgi:hypothetical protein
MHAHGLQSKEDMTLCAWFMHRNVLDVRACLHVLADTGVDDASLDGGACSIGCELKLKGAH